MMDDEEDDDEIQKAEEPKKPEYLYRFYETLVSAGVDEFDNPVGPPRVEVYVERFTVVKWTPKGAWIHYCCGKRFVFLGEVRKKFACRTIAEAKESFIARKKAHIQHLQRKMHTVERALCMIDAVASRYERGQND